MFVVIAKCLLLNKRKGMNLLKEISKEEIKKLIKNGYIKNTNEGYVDLNKKIDGKHVKIGYYKTIKGRHRYIQDEFADIARNLK